tara:strand:- start:113 stop:664 length:552 start_codon:yes stop_codon:yes gene_type:complete
MNPAYYRYGIPTLGGAVVGGVGAAQDGGDFGNVLGGTLLGAGIGAGAAGAARSFDVGGPAAEGIAKRVSQKAGSAKGKGKEFLDRQVAQLLAQTPDSEVRKSILMQGGQMGRNILNPLVATSAGDVSGIGATALGYGSMLPAGAIAGGVASMLSPIDPESYGSSNLPQTRANSLYQMTSNLNR